MNPISGLLIGTLLSVSMVPAGPDQAPASKASALTAPQPAAAPALTASALTAVDEARACLALAPRVLTDAAAGSHRKTTRSDWLSIDLAGFALDARPDDARPKAESAVTSANGSQSAAGSDRTAARDTPARQVLVFKATWCGACQLLNPAWPKLRKVNWRVGDRPTDHFRLVDSDEFPGLVAQYGITALPTIVLLENGREVRRTGRILKAADLAEFYYGRLQ